ncbi:MAG: DUF1365 domain-containing protein [Psychrobacter sp.]|nr:DUF1365 domain-containing protein [Psychrobacter sp.]
MSTKVNNKEKALSTEDGLSDSCLPHQLFHGTTWHSRLLPSVHKFAYPYRYWGINISALAAGQVLPEVGIAIFGKANVVKNRWLKELPLFSAKKKALQQFCPDDYLQGLNSQGLNSQRRNVQQPNSLSNNENDDSRSNPIQALNHRLSQAFTEQTGSEPTGDIIGMVVCRNAGIYFSPVNFYLGFDKQQTPTHLLAEVSNTPWDKRHYYGFLLAGESTEFCHDKDFHVSPFNPIDQLYRWQVKIKNQPDNGLQVRIAIDISDERGEVLKTGIKMSGVPMTARMIRNSLRKNPLMNVTSLTRIYWHAFKLYAIKKVPYINYDEKLADSQQQADKKPDVEKNKH